jgi:acyl CoA:acetate/3-ketoacid CoA transferase
VRLKEDVLDQMSFSPRVAQDLTLMNPKLFTEGPMGLGKAFVTTITGETK